MVEISLYIIQYNVYTFFLFLKQTVTYNLKYYWISKNGEKN